MGVVDVILLWTALGAITACIVGMNSTNRGNLPWTLAIGITFIWPLFWVKWIAKAAWCVVVLFYLSFVDAFRQLFGKAV